MAEHPAAPPGGAPASELDVLLATKVYVPSPQPGFVYRPRLVAALDEGLSRRLMLVCAPAGFGKTALLADWVQRSPRPVAWLSLDSGDNDPGRFWRHVVAALDRACPGIADRLRPLLGPAAAPSLEGVVTALINELASQLEDGEVLLVLDDFHVIDAQPVHASLEFLVEHLPLGLHLLLASRSDPPLPLARLRAGGELGELRADELRFTVDEVAALLRGATGTDLPPATVAVLAARTEGWAAGLQLAALSMRGQADVSGFVEAFSGSNRYVLDYLAEEVLERQPEDVRTFLLETSVLERLSGALCDAVTGRADSQAMLERVERANLFLVPLDEVSGWWRYHHLFADLLRSRLRQERPGRVAALHRAAAAWCEDHGLPDDAVRHALAAGDAEWAAQLIEMHFDETFFGSRYERATIQRWLAPLPAELLRSRPRLLLAQLWMALVGGDVEVVSALWDAAEHASAESADEPFEPSVGRAASRLVNIQGATLLARAYSAHLQGDAQGTAAFAAQALAEIGEGEWMLDSTARWLLAVSEWLRGRLAEAERGFAATITACRAAGERGLAAAACHFLGLVQRAQGRLDDALDTYSQTLEITAPAGPAMPAAGIAYVGMGEVAYQRNDLDTALEHVTTGVARCRQLNFTQPLITGLTALAWIRQAKGDTGGAQAAMGEAGRAAPGSAVTGLLNPVPALQAQLLLARADLPAAARWAEEGGLNPNDQPLYHREREYLTLARVLLAQDQPDPAVALLERLHVAAASQGRTGSMIEIEILQALALARAGDDAGAVDALAGALTLGCPQGYVRVFADEGPPMAALLAQLVAAQKTGHAAARSVPLGYLAHVLRAFGSDDIAPDVRRPAVAAVPGLAEQLTGREREILALLAAGSPNPRIAEQLVVTVDTVKKHVSHVLAKLGAGNRTEAVSRARQLGLIP